MTIKIRNINTADRLAPKTGVADRWRKQGKETSRVETMMVRIGCIATGEKSAPRVSKTLNLAYSFGHLFGFSRNNCVGEKR